VAAARRAQPPGRCSWGRRTPSSDCTAARLSRNWEWLFVHVDGATSSDCTAARLSFNREWLLIHVDGATSSDGTAARLSLNREWLLIHVDGATSSDCTAAPPVTILYSARPRATRSACALRCTSLRGGAERPLRAAQCEMPEKETQRR